MVGSRSGLRVFGLDIEGRTEPVRNAGLYRALDKRLHVTGTFTPELPLVQKRLIQLRCIAPGRDRWRRRAGLSPATFKALTKLTERELRAREGAFDVILQLYCVFAAGRVDIGRRYALYLDATAALTRRDFPEGAPIGRRAHRRWFAMEQAAYHRAGRLFPTSEWVRQSLIEDYRVDPARLVVAGAGSNVVAEPIIDRRWDQRVALFVGLDWKRKGGPVLLRAWRQVRDVLPDAELWIAGTRSAYGKDGEGGVRWFGRVDQGRLAALYREASVFVLPSLFDPFPHVLREAMSHGLPCISTPTGGTAEIIKDGHDGILVPAGDADTLARELVALLGKPRRAESMGRAGHARMNEDVTWQSVADLMVPHLEAIARE